MEKNDLPTSSVVIVNPKSQGGTTENNTVLSRILNKSFHKSKIIYTKKQGDATRLTRYYLKRGFKEVIAVGGDGTINEVGNGFFAYDEKSNSMKSINPNAIFSFIPSGTRNVFATSLNLPMDLNEYATKINNLKKKKLDIISVQYTVPGTSIFSKPRLCFNAVEIGAGAEIIKRSKLVRSKVNSRFLSTIAGIVSTLPAYESNLCEIIVDDEITIKPNITMCMISNGQYLGGSFKVAPQAQKDDGFLDIVIVKDSGSFKMLREIISMKNGIYLENDNIMYFRAKKIYLESKQREVSLSLDGEPVGILPASFHVLQKKLLMKF
ncbi:MAG: diacylglycerol/lipid kinase family protein [Candidatus Thorarchaeota archaeon]